MEGLTQWDKTIKITERLYLENFNLETALIEEQMRNDSTELSQFNLETMLLEKGVI